MNRTFSSCPQIVTDAGTEITKSNPAPPFQSSEKKSHSKSKTGRTSVETSSRSVSFPPSFPLLSVHILTLTLILYVTLPSTPSQSESCGLSIPEIDLVLQPGTLGGRFTTLEGILDQVYEELSTKVFETGEFSNLSVPDGGDSSVRDAAGHTTFEGFLRALKEVKSAERPFTLILDDPLANSYLQNIYAPDEDPNMESVVYERTWQQNEELGLNDMKVEGYEEDAKEDAKEGKTEETKA